MRFRSLGALSASVGIAAAIPTSAFGLAGGQPGKDRTTAQKSHAAAASYIVRMSDEPVVSYDGAVAGYEATAPAKGKKVNPGAPASRSTRRTWTGSTPTPPRLSAR